MEPSVYHYEMEKPLDFVPRRVVSLVPSVTESLFDLGLGDRIVGITDFCKPATLESSALPRVGGARNPRIEMIMELAPDLVVMNQDENRHEDVEALGKSGISVWVTSPRSVQDALNLLWTMMDVFDEAGMVYRVRTIEQTVDFISRIELTRASPCRVFAAISHDPLTTFNRDTFTHDLLRVCGGTNVFADHAVRYPSVSVEDIVAAQPDVILLPSQLHAVWAEQMAMLAELDVPAVREQRIHLVDESLLTWHGTRIAHALTIIPALLCPTDNM